MTLYRVLYVSEVMTLSLRITESPPCSYRVSTRDLFIDRYAVGAQVFVKSGEHAGAVGRVLSVDKVLYTDTLTLLHCLHYIHTSEPGCSAALHHTLSNLWCLCGHTGIELP
jgi:hypothetical protein